MRQDWSHRSNLDHPAIPRLPPPDTAQPATATCPLPALMISQQAANGGGWHGRRTRHEPGCPQRRQRRRKPSLRRMRSASARNSPINRSTRPCSPGLRAAGGPAGPAGHGRPGGPGYPGCWRAGGERACPDGPPLAGCRCDPPVAAQVVDLPPGPGFCCQGRAGSRSVLAATRRGLRLMPSSLPGNLARTSHPPLITMPPTGACLTQYWLKLTWRERPAMPGHDQRRCQRQEPGARALQQSLVL